MAIRSVSPSDLVGALRQMSISSLRLPCREQFIIHPLFKDAKEKEDVYQKLVEIADQDGFEENYTRFLDAIRKENWGFYCGNYFLEFAYLSIIAFFEGKIDEEQLCCIHTVAEAYRELQNGTISGVEVHVLSNRDRCSNAEFLEKAHQPPFAPIGNTPLVRSQKNAQELNVVKINMLDHIERITSPVSRSVVVYTVQSHADLSIEVSIHHVTKVQERYIDSIEDARGEVNVVMFPHHLGVHLNNGIGLYPLPEALKHEWIFGYAKDVRGVLEKGVRIATVASPLFKVPNVHGHQRGPKGLGLQMHDENYHIPLDLNVPDVIKKRFSELSQQILNTPCSSTSLQTQSLWKKKITTCSNLILDRELWAYRWESDPKKIHLESFWSHCLIGMQHQYFPKWYQNVFLPLVKRVVYNKRDDNAMPHLSESISRDLLQESKKHIESDMKKAWKFAEVISSQTMRYQAFNSIAREALKRGSLKDVVKVAPLLDPLDRMRLCSQVRKAIRLNLDESRSGCQRGRERK